jgi:integrase
VTDTNLPRFSGRFLKRVQRRQRVPVVLTREKVKAALALMEGTCRLMAEPMYGAGLRVHECVTLRFKDIDLASKTVSVRNSEGNGRLSAYGFLPASPPA